MTHYSNQILIICKQLNSIHNCFKLVNNSYLITISQSQCKLTIVKGNAKTPFSIATTPSCREECYPFIIDPYCIMLCIKQGGIKYYFFRRCPWCSRYRRRKWTRQHEFKSWTRLIAFHIALIPLGKV